MAISTGDTLTTSLADSLNDMVATARNTRDRTVVMPGLVRREKLSEGTGMSWKQIQLGQATAQRVTETTTLNNPQQHTDTALSITPTMIGYHSFISDATGRRIDKKVFGKLGVIPGQAMQKLIDYDGFLAIDSFTNSLCGTGSTLTSGYIATAAARIRGNTTEEGPEPINAVFHDYGIKDLWDELVAGVGTYVLTQGRTAEVFANGFQGMINGVKVHRGNVPIDSTPDSKGGVFSKNAIILVEGFPIKKETQRDASKGGGGTNLYMYYEYAYGEDSAGNWGYEVMHDATTPTS